MSHTPGPWEVLGPYPSINVGILVDGGCGGEYPEPPRYEALCQVYLDPQFKQEASDETKANAYLMAASPDLLAALEAVPLPSTSGECEADFCRRFFEWWESHAKPAIDKAKGTQ